MNAPFDAEQPTPLADALGIPERAPQGGLTFPPEEGADRLRLRAKRVSSGKTVGAPANPRTVIKAPKAEQGAKQLPDFVTGNITFDDWRKRHEQILTPQEIHEAGRWYNKINGVFARYYPGEPEKAHRHRNAWLVAQQNISPPGAMNNVLMQQEQLNRGVPRNLWVAGGMPNPTEAARAVLTDQPITGGVGQKISDFVDSAEGKSVRSWMNNHPSGGAPFVVDVHTARDAGMVDQELVNHLTRLGYDQAALAGLKKDLGTSPGQPQYENRADWGRGLTKHLNEIKWMGRSDWTPAEIQAVGWMGMTKLTRNKEEGAEEGLERNLRRVSYELSPGEHSPWHQKYGHALDSLPEEAKYGLTQEMTVAAMHHARNLAGVSMHSLVHGTGAWEKYQNPAAVGQMLATEKGASIAANALGYLLNQTEVWHNRVKPPTKNPGGYAIDLIEHGGTTHLDDPKRLSELWEAVMSADKTGLIKGYQPITTPSGERGIRALIDKGGAKTGTALYGSLRDGGDLDRVLKTMPYDIRSQIHEAEISKARNDWKAHPHGQAYLSGLQQALGRDPRADLDRARQQLEKDLEAKLDQAHAKAGTAWRQEGAVKRDGFAEGGEVDDSTQPAMPERELSPIGLYSHAGEQAEALPQMKGTPEQFKAMLLRKGVKPDELRWSGYDQAMAGKKLVTKQEVAQHFRSKMPSVRERVLGKDSYDYDPDKGASGKPKFGDYTLPGGQNYREVLLRLPDMGRPPSFEEWHKQTQLGDVPPPGRLRDVLNYDYHRDVKNMPREGTYRSGHWDEPNVLAHLRLSDRVDPTGKKILHLEELQSDWAQEGRKKGFANPEDQANFDRLHAELGTAKAALAEHHKRVLGASTGATSYQDILRDPDKEAKKAAFNDAKMGDRDYMAANARVMTLENELRKVNPVSKVPHAPYVDSTQKWVDLGLKRLLHEAAVGGYDKIAVTPGEEQAKRYDLSKHISRIEALTGFGKSATHPYYIRAFDKAGDPVHSGHHKGEELSNVIGKDLADRIIKEHGAHAEGTTPFATEYKGLDLKVGGEGMKSFYDKILPQQLEKLAKRHDPEAKVHMGGHKMSAGLDWKTIRANKKNLGAVPDTALHSLDITPRMRASILKGQLAFATGGRTEHAVSVRKAAGGSVNHNPTEAQKAAGNYAKKRISFQGLPISIENEKGSTRTGVDDRGKPWSARLPADYGYVRGTTGADWDHVDCFVGPDRSSNLVVVINQQDHRNGKFDEHKCMLGFASERAACDAYIQAFSDGNGHRRVGSVETMSVDAFKNWLKRGPTAKPAHGPTIVDKAFEIIGQH